MGNLKYVVQENSVLVSYLGRKRRIALPKHHSVENLIHFICVNTDKVFGINQGQTEQFSTYKNGRQIFRISKKNEKSLKRYFPSVRPLSKKERYLLKQTLPLLSYLKGSYYIEVDDFMMLHQFREGISIYHVLDTAKTEFKLPTTNQFLDINILKNIYFSNLIESIDIINSQGQFMLKIFSPEKQIYSFEDTNIDGLIFKAIKELMESKLSYSSIGIGRSKVESYEDFLNKQGNGSASVYCQDSLAQHLGLVLTKEWEK